MPLEIIFLSLRYSVVALIWPVIFCKFSFFNIKWRIFACAKTMKLINTFVNIIIEDIYQLTNKSSKKVKTI